MKGRKMHICIEMSGENNIILPIHYNHIVQAFIYKTIDKELADFYIMKVMETTGSFVCFVFQIFQARLK